MTRKCKCHLYILPFVGILLIIFAYLVYVIGFCVFLIQNILESILYILFFSILFILLLWCFLSTIFTPVATVPSKFKLTDEEIELLNNCEDVNKKMVLDRIFLGKDLIVNTRYPPGYIRYCLKCKHIKPDRARHCSSCGVCVLKMDHHCPWINNCVGFSNYKTFMLFLLYLALYCFYILATSAKYLREILVNKEGQAIVVGLFIAIFFGLFAVTLLIFHCTLIFKNETSIDKLQKPVFETENSTFDLGCYQNFTEVFGENWRLWPFPVFTSLGSGYSFTPKIMNCSNV